MFLVFLSQNRKMIIFFRRKMRRFEIKDLPLRSIKHNLSLFPSLSGVHIASNSVGHSPMEQRKRSLT